MKMATKKKYFLLLVTVLSLVKLSSQQVKPLKMLYQWREMEFQFPSQEDRENAILNNVYIPGNSVPIDVDVDYRGIIVAVISFKLK